MSDMTQSFIEMVEAYKAKPELEAQIKALGEDNAMCYQTIDLLRQQITDLQGKVTSTETRLSEVTKERDDASFRNLELDEKLSGIEKLLGVAERLEQARQQGHQAGVDAMTPKPEEVNEPQPESFVDDWSAFKPLHGIEQPGPIDPIAVSPQGQSENRPTVADSAEVLIKQPTTTSKDGPETQTPSEPKINPYSGFPIHYPDGEYKGQPYYEKPSWVSWAAWCDAGGEPEPYMQQVTR